VKLCELLAVPTGIIAAVGGGGKTSLLWRLAQELSENAKVLITTTTHMWPPGCQLLYNPTKARIREAFTQASLVAAGNRLSDGKMCEPLGWHGNFQGLADYVLVEADGSRGLPLKAPAEHEPVIPDNTALTLAVAGMTCVGQTIETAAHRAALYASRAGVALATPVTPALVAERLCATDGQRKNVPGAFVVVLNQADTPERLTFARLVAERCDANVVILALQSKPDWAEVHPAVNGI